MTAKHVNLVCSPIPLRSSTEYSASTIPYSCWRRCSSSHSPQLSTETNNETKYGNDSMLELQAMDDKDDEEEEGEGDPDVDDEDKEEEDLLAYLDDDEREELIN